MAILSGDFLHAKAFEALNESLGYELIGVGVAVGLGIMFGLNAIHSLPPNHAE
jgi:geranylgeranyl pyrophosphate synthase